MSFAINHLIGFGGRRGSSATAPTRSFVTSAADTSASTTSRTFSSVSLGDAATGRRIAVGFSAYAPSSQTLSSATIGGQSATIACQVNGTNVLCGIIIAQVDSGTTGDVVLNWSASCQYHVIAVWRIVDLTTSTAYATGTSTGTSLSANLNVPANGLCFAFATSIDGAPTAPGSWSGLTSDGTLSAGAAIANGFASLPFSSAQTPLTVSATASGSRSAMAVASYGN